MKIGPKINATEFIETPQCLNETWKIAAVQKNIGGDLGWQWFGEIAEDKAARGGLIDSMYARNPAISACSGRQFVNGFMEMCLYMRVWPRKK